ncbi:hypothetical protein [Rhodospirillum centenum]|uniref:Uncharacterized protein n=1 Tax=Rhodospirillum centenum (strain ATCC 51521 / SW) TaxID=414684 RepID=B6IWW9_RHOCS|nr:hypothetical protein [Rhodospirillum centenum]ACJ00793.1 hypothetical protein RC1_3435 [Rhodospirillum centenum SW]
MSAQDVAVWLGIIAGVGAAAQVASTVQKRLQRMHQMQEGRLRQLREATRQLRDKARISLDLKREERAMRRELAELQAQIESGDDTVARETSQEAWLYIFDDRFSPGDKPFTVVVSHPDFRRVSRNAPAEVVESWQAGRRYLMFAAVDKLAQAKATQRHPPERGFVVGPVSLYEGNLDEV